MSKGFKDDSAKSRVSLIPREAIEMMGKALGHGEKKYGSHNFRKGIQYSRLIDACIRHLVAFNDGEDIDVDSGNNHVSHAMASLAMLSFMMSHRPDLDDRWKPEAKEEESIAYVGLSNDNYDAIKIKLGL